MASISRAEKSAIHMADSIIEMIHLMYQTNTAKRFVNSLISRLIERKDEFVPTKEKSKEVVQ